MTTFEEGYKAHLNGLKDKDNPYDPEKCPYSFRQWMRGWMAREKLERKL